MQCLSPYQSRLPTGQLLKVPCGRCMACRINRTREWTIRLVDESLYSDNAYFVTLTYDDEHLPRSELLYKCPPLPHPLKSDVQKFIRSIRDHYGHDGKKLKYFCGSEYGDLGRPHYHLIMYNCPDDLFRPSDNYKQGDMLSFKDPETHSLSMINRHINDFWQRGFVTVGDFCRERASYCAKYLINKQNTPYHSNPNLDNCKELKCFSLMSKGLGLHQAEAIKEKSRFYDLHTVQTDLGTFAKMPRYYRKKIWSDNERLSYLDNIDSINKSYDLAVGVTSSDYEYQLNRKYHFKNKKSKL